MTLQLYLIKLKYSSFFQLFSTSTNIKINTQTQFLSYLIFESELLHILLLGCFLGLCALPTVVGLLYDAVGCLGILQKF